MNLKNVHPKKMFTYQELENFLSYAKKNALITSLRDWNHKNGIILRHDVDFDIHAAYKLSKIEKKLGIISTFFVMTSCHTYNPLSPVNRKLLSEMVKDGFEIGLHFDPTVWEDICFNDLEERVGFECRILESVIKDKITSISLHNPSISGKYPIFKGYNNAYAKNIFSDECYLSDSAMSFRGLNPYEFINKATSIPIQILLHPMHWSEKGENYVEIIYKTMHRLIDDIDRTFRVNYTYKECVGGDKLWDIIIRTCEDKKEENK